MKVEAGWNGGRGGRYIQLRGQTIRGNAGTQGVVSDPVPALMSRLWIARLWRANVRMRQLLTSGALTG